MDFFKSVFSDEPDSPKSEPDSKSSNSQSQVDSDPSSLPNQQNLNPNPNSSDGSAGGNDGGWWGLMKSLTTKSESVIEIYRRDLKEFGSGLKKEIEVAHGSLETVGHTIDEIGSTVLKGTAQIISQGKEAIVAADHESDSSDNNERNIISQQSLNSKPYSRFDAQVRAIQGDASTYSEEPEDLDDYKKWRLGFVLEEKREEVESFLEENSAMESIYRKVVPHTVDEETFWGRYYYKLYKLKQAQDVRANLVKRAISREEEDLSWDVEDDEEEKNENQRNVSSKANALKENEDRDLGQQSEQIANADDINNEEFEHTVNVKEEQLSVQKSGGEKASNDDNVASHKVELEKSKEENVSKYDEKEGSEGKGDNGESSKDSDISIISSHPSMPEEEDLGWDEIEDLSSIDEKKASDSGSPNKVDLRKRLSVAEEEEDLSWDIEDDDEPIKS